MSKPKKSPPAGERRATSNTLNPHGDHVTTAAPAASPSPARVVNAASGEPFDILVGHKHPRFSHRPVRRWLNPFHFGPHGDRDRVMELYRAHLLGRPELLRRLPELRGKVLACWCPPAACHGDILIEMAALPDGELERLAAVAEVGH
ncbi:MAG: DUF4326 domain-containing protein [Bryobacterales bacterium]|nr:DUF4326 domain-containing protein [Bryobacterales bacterium]